MPLLITTQNHRLGRARRAAALPARLPRPIKPLPRTLHPAWMCVLNTGSCNQKKLIFSIFCPSGGFANIKEGKGWCGISVCLLLLLYETAPRHRREAAEEIEFHHVNAGTWQVGLWFTCSVGLTCERICTKHV